jgi:drug/metabolite transporter (DMT)-like permease
MALDPNIRSAFCMSAAMALFTMGDALSKAVLGSMQAGEVLLIRGIFATLLLLLISWKRGALRRDNWSFHPMLLLRVAGEAASAICFLLAISMLPLANVVSIMQVLPLVVTLGAALFYKEAVGWRRWLAIMAGFVGVIVILYPDLAAFNLFALAALFAVMFCAIRDLATRRIPLATSSLFVATATSVGVTLTGGMLTVTFGSWPYPTFQQTVLLLVASVLLVTGYQLIVTSIRMGEMTFVAPFRYTNLLCGTLIGIFVFGERLNFPTVLGSFLIIASGSYAFYREYRRSKL